MNFLEEALGRATNETLIINQNLDPFYSNVICEELRTQKVEYRDSSDFCSPVYKPNVEVVKKINPKIVGKIFALTKNGESPVGKIVDGTQITEEMIVVEWKNKEIEGFNSNSENGICVGVKGGLNWKGLHDGLISLMIREVNNFRKELKYDLTDRALVMWYFDFDRYAINGNLTIGKCFRNVENAKFIKEETVSTHFLEAVDLSYFTHKYSEENTRWYEDGGIRIWKI